jgi:hypothetical protein
MDSKLNVEQRTYRTESTDKERGWASPTSLECVWKPFGEVTIGNNQK